MEDDERRETGEVFSGTDAELASYLAQREREDGWVYQAEPA